MANAFRKLPGAAQRLWHTHAEGKSGAWVQIYETAGKGRFMLWCERWNGTALLSTTCINDSVPYLEKPVVTVKGNTVRVIAEQTHQPDGTMPLWMAVSLDGGVTWA